MQVEGVVGSDGGEPEVVREGWAGVFPVSPTGDGTFVGLDGYHAGEVLTVVRDGDRVLSLDVGTFVYSRTPYDPAAPQPGGVDEQGWRAGPA